MNYTKLSNQELKETVVAKLAEKADNAINESKPKALFGKTFEYYDDLTNKAVDLLNKDLKSIFRNQDVKAYRDKHSFIETLVVSVFSSKVNSARVDNLNSQGKITLMMHLDPLEKVREVGAPLPPSMEAKVKFTFGVLIGRTSAIGEKIKYRKINGGDPLQAAKKLIAWFKKNKDHFLATE